MKENYFGNVNYQNNIKIVEPGKTSLLSNNTITTNWMGVELLLMQMNQKE